MDVDAYKLEHRLEGEFIKLKWTLQPGYENPLLPQYPEVEMEFKYTDVSRDTVMVMLRKMRVPAMISDAIMSRIADAAA